MQQQGFWIWVLGRFSYILRPSQFPRWLLHPIVEGIIGAVICGMALGIGFSGYYFFLLLFPLGLIINMHGYYRLLVRKES